MHSVVPTPGAYVSTLQQWRPLTHREMAVPTVDQLTLATFNVWFADEYFDQRCSATLALLQRYQPHVITLQEVTPAFLAQLLQTPWVQQAYCLSDISGASIDPYGVLILSRLPILDWQCLVLPSTMGRHLVTARTTLNQTTTVFASVHLESGSSAAFVRAKQLARIFPLLIAEPHVMLSGDFNFCSSWHENSRLDPTYQDIWPLLHPTESGFTEDTTTNTMRLRHTGKQKQVRFDRILLRSQQPGWRAEAITLIGTEPIGNATPDIFPSDHFGLVSRFVWQSERIDSREGSS